MPRCVKRTDARFVEIDTHTRLVISRFNNDFLTIMSLIVGPQIDDFDCWALMMIIAASHIDDFDLKLLQSNEN